ncbi:MAG: tetratricopeptide repeat protein [Desulfoplanes sp.]
MCDLMAVWKKMRSLFSRKASVSDGFFLSIAGGNALPTKDTLAAIDELSRVVKNNSDSVEIYHALGNLYRSQGELERAIQIRQNLIIRPGLDPNFKARAYFELGKDYKRAGFMDRSLDAFAKAREMCGDDPEILRELGDIAARVGDFLLASQYYAALKYPLAQAHYLVLYAHAFFSGKREEKEEDGAKWLSKALKVYPGSVEGWLERITQAYEQENWNSFEKYLKKGFENIDENLRFVLLEGLIQFAQKQSLKDTGPYVHPEACARAIPCIEAFPQDLLLYYYGSLLLVQANETEQAQIWLEKALMLDPDFWPIRLEVLRLSMPEQSLSPVFKVQLEFFLTRAQRVKRFVCSHCGLKREQLFYVCPRCQTWHSIRFRKSLND